MKILSLSAFIPEQICDIVRFCKYPGKQGISHYCAYVSDYISQIIYDDSIDGAVFPKSCDSSRVIRSYCMDSGKFLYQMPVPARRDRAAIQYMAFAVKEYKSSVERHYGITLDDIPERIAIINERNQKIARIYDELDSISYASYLEALHNMLTLPLWEQQPPEKVGAGPAHGKKVYLVGSYLYDTGIARAVEAAGMNIVGDNLTESKRLFSAPPVQAEGNLYENIAESILGAPLSPTQNAFAEILAADRAELQEKKIAGVIYVSQKYCEPYDYLFSVYKKMLDECGIPVLKLSLSDTKDNKRADIAMEAFADTL